MDQPVTSREETRGFVSAAGDGARAGFRMTAIVVIVALAGLAWTVHARHRSAAALSLQTETDQILTVATAQPRPDGAATELVLPGNLQADYEAPIYARTSGYLRRWYVDIGARVRKGQLLAQIEA